jgi:hypothetical protein
MKYIVLCCLTAMLYSCGKKDEEIIIGKWQSDQDWFEYHQDQTYSAGKMIMTMVKNFKYNIDTKAKELTMYTDEENQTYYLIYRFIGNDTMAIRNRLSTDTTMVKFYRVKKN